MTLNLSVYYLHHVLSCVISLLVFLLSFGGFEVIWSPSGSPRFYVKVLFI